MTEPGARLTFPLARRWLIAVPAALTAVLLLAAWVDGRRRDAQLATMLEGDCAIGAEPGVRTELEALASEPAPEAARARAIAERVQAYFPSRRSVEILYQRGDTVCTVSPRHGPSVWDDETLQRAAGGWTALTAEPGCRGFRLDVDSAGQAYDRTFAVVISLSFLERPVVIVSRQRLLP